MVQLPVGTENFTREAIGANFVEVLFARTRGEADRFCRVLDENAIPAQIERNDLLPAQCGIAVLVPSDRLVDASSVLTSMGIDEDEDDFEIDDSDDDDDFDDDDDDDFDDLDDDDNVDDDEEDFDEDDDDM